MSKSLEFVTGQQDALLRDLEQLVNLDSLTGSKQLVDQAMQVVVARFQELIGGSVQWIPQEKYGNQVKLQIG